MAAGGGGGGGAAKAASRCCSDVPRTTARTAGCAASVPTRQCTRGGKSTSGRTARAVASSRTRRSEAGGATQMGGVSGIGGDDAGPRRGRACGQRLQQRIPPEPTQGADWLPQSEQARAKSKGGQPYRHVGQIQRDVVRAHAANVEPDERLALVRAHKLGAPLRESRPLGLGIVMPAAAPQPIRN